MTWPCGECGTKWPEAVPRCPACDVREIKTLTARVHQLEQALAMASSVSVGAGQVPVDIDPREGIATVYDHEGRYLGCIGVETWRSLLDQRQVPADTIERLVAYIEDAETRRRQPIDFNYTAVPIDGWWKIRAEARRLAAVDAQETKT